MPNFEEKTVLNLLLDKQDYKRLNYLLKYLSKYPADHHSRQIKNLIPTLIKEELPAIY